MDRRAGACGASFLPSWPSFQGLSSAFRTDSLVLAICDPLTGIIDAETRLASAEPRVVIKHRGAKSPKSTRKQAAQKQARAAATKEKGRADCCRRDADFRGIGRRSCLAAPSSPCVSCANHVQLARTVGLDRRTASAILGT